MSINKENAKQIIKDILVLLDDGNMYDTMQLNNKIKNLDENTLDALVKRWNQYDSESKLRDKMSEGWNIGIECKGTGRAYGMSYEGTATLVGKFFGDDEFKIRHAVGDTLDEFVDNLFNNQEAIQKGMDLINELGVDLK